MLQNTWPEVENCLDICWATKGARVEICQGTSKLGNYQHLSLQFSCFIYISLGNINFVTEILSDTLYLPKALGMCCKGLGRTGKSTLLIYV
jgi:hypothetical protein